MSETALAVLRRLWVDLRFATVRRVITKPEDRLILDPDNPGNSWRHYFGFASLDGEDVYFQRDDYCELDFDISLTLNFSRYGNHTGGWTPPNRGDLVCGVVMSSSRGKRFVKWFTCHPAVKALIDVVRKGHTDKSEDELARLMVCPGFPDKVWALARLFLFDNVEAFVDQVRYQRTDGFELPPHPAHGLPTGSVTGRGEKLTVQHRGMWLSMEVAKYVHVLSYQFEPKWWEKFCELMKERDLSTAHLRLGDYCPACSAGSDYSMDDYGASL